MNIDSVLIAIAVLFMAAKFLWPYIAKLKIEEGVSLWDFMKIHLPNLAIRVFGVLIIVTIPLLVAYFGHEIVDKMTGTQEVYARSFLLIIIWIAYYFVVHNRFEGAELALVLLLYPFIIAMVVHPFVGSFVDQSNLNPDQAAKMIKGYQAQASMCIGFYMVFLGVFWTCTYYPRHQHWLALPIAFVILVALGAYDNFLKTGNWFFLSKGDPNWAIAIWPLVFYMVGQIVFTFVFWKDSPWRQRWMYRLICVGMVYYMIMAVPAMVLMLTGDLSGERIVSIIETNQAMAMSVRAREKNVDLVGEAEKMKNEIKKINSVLVKGTKVQNADRLLQSKIKRLQAIEEEKRKIAKNKPKRIGSWSLLFDKIQNEWPWVVRITKEAKNKLS